MMARPGARDQRPDLRSQTMSGGRPLSGVRVLDLTRVFAGPVAGRVLVDLGADVVKVEPLHGEVARWMSPPQEAGLTGFYAQQNRNKRSIAIDM